jgi:6-phosphogluconate dehydrogenase
MMHQARGTANLLQAQRDFFGAHGFERVDRSGSGFHGPWGDTRRRTLTGPGAPRDQLCDE